MPGGASALYFKVRSLMACLTASPLVLAAQTPEALTVLTLGVVPVYASAEVHKRAHPLVVTLATVCKQPVKLALSRSAAEFEARFKKGAFDLVFLNPYHMVMAHKAQGYIPLVREGKEPSKGLLVVRADSTIRTVADLNGKTVAFPSPNTFSASLYLRALLEREHKVKIQVQYAKTHSNSFRQVIAGEADAAGGALATLSNEPREITDLLRVIYQTPPVTNHPLAAHPRVPADVRDCIQQTLLSAPANSPLKAQLTYALMANPIAASYVRDYQPLEKLALERYVVNEPFVEKAPL